MDELVSTILDAAVEGILIIDAKGKVGSINPAALRMFGYTAEEVVGRNVSMLMPAPHRDEHDGYIAEYLATGARKIIGIGRETTGRRKDGTEFPLELAVSEVRLGDRQIFTGFVRDITERKEAERALREQRDFAEGLIETAQAIVLVLDPAGRVVRFNKYMEELSGYALEEVKGKEWFDVFLPERDRARIREVFGDAIADLEVRGNINAIVTKDGMEREISWWAKTMKDEDGKVIGLLSVGHNVTELRDAQERVVQAERLAGIGEMIAGLAHESRNALQRMQACLEMLSLEVEDRAEALDYVRRIQKAQDYLSQLYDEVRNYAAPLKLEMQECDLRRLWGVDNAITAVGAEGKISADCQAGRSAVALTFSDSGSGLDADQKERIFRPFYSTKTQGTGLGLAIVKRIVEAHGGRVAVGTGSLPGAAIVVTLPRRGD
ncbi:MAG: PAS domain S-box protein [Planctomycetota bacterium]|jgi:PAS domain S-box-containing protein